MKAVGLNRTDWLLLGVMLAMAAVAALLAYAATPPEQRGSGELEIASSFFNDKPGVMALYQTWDRLGQDVQRLRRPYSSQTLAGHSGLVVLRPLREISESEADDLLAWVADGGTLLLAPVGPVPQGWFTFSFHRGETEPQPVSREEQLTEDSLTEGVGTLVSRRGLRFNEKFPADSPLAGQNAKVLWKDDAGVVAMRVGYGRGKVILLGDVYPLSNIGLGEADNPVFAANIAAELAGGDGAIAFDEYHHGFEHRDVSAVAIVKMIARERGWAVLQLAGVGLLALVLAAVRFGPAIDVMRTRRRRHAEFIDAAAALLDEAGATGPAYATLVHHYRERLARACHLPPDVNDDELANSGKQKTRLDILPALKAAPGRPPTPDPRGLARNKLYQHTQTLHKAAEAIEHGTA